jgi:ribosome-binding protein aMBF1 (putative translation factor)
MRARAKTIKTSDAVELLDRMAVRDPELESLTDAARVNATVAQLIYAARQKAGLSQVELAERIGSKQAVISRLEDADYDGHSLTMLQRIAAALGKQVTVEFQDIQKAPTRRRPSGRLADVLAGS